MVSKAGIVKRSRDAERRLAAIVGGKRNPSTGEEGKPDVETYSYVFELKSLQSLPKWLTEAVEQARRGAAAGSIPVTVFEERRPGGRNVRFYIYEEADFLRLTGRDCIWCEQRRDLEQFPERERYVWVCSDCLRGKRKARKVVLARELEKYKTDRGCMDCGIKDFRILDFDHVPGREPKGDKSPHEFARIGRRQLMLQEVAKCDVVCSNCHRIRTYERRIRAVTPTGKEATAP